MIINDIRKQKAASGEHPRVISKQIAMLSQVTSALGLEVPADSPEEPDAPAKDDPIDMIEMYLRLSEQTKQNLPPRTYRRPLE